MIKRLKIKNFQSHKHTELALSPGVNVIVGRNMTGKSALLRALRLALYNKPEGSMFVRWGEKNAEVEIEYGGHIIKRIKGKQNVYEVDGSVFSGFGKTIPQEVIDVLGFSILQVDRNTYELNFDHPHDAPFFISETDATKGKIFSKLGERVLRDLLLLDKSIRAANAELRKLGSEKTVLIERATATEGTLAGFAPLEDADTLILQCDKSIAQAIGVEETIDVLERIKLELQVYAKDISLGERLTDIDLTPIEGALLKAGRLIEDIDSLEELQSSMAGLDAVIGNLEARSFVREDLPEASLEEAQSILTSVRELLAVQSSLGKFDRDIASLENHQQELSSVLQSAVDSYRDMLMKAKNCPICHRPVEEHDMGLIIKELTGE